MPDRPIKDTPSLRKLREDAQNFTALKAAWPLLRPLLRALGAKVEDIDHALKRGEALVAKTDEFTALPDEFNAIFAKKGWIMYDRMDIDLARKAIQLAQAGATEDAEKALLDFYTPDQIQRQLWPLSMLAAFKARMPLAEKALRDFREERYYASVLVVLSLLDGMVNEIQQRGFFSQTADLTAWDSVAAHSLGLQKLASVLARSRKKTNAQEIDMPYRHGIMHGMDLGYDNRSVAVKSWVALFAARDWAVRAESDQLEAPPPRPEKSLKEVLYEWRRLQEDKKVWSTWKPRGVIIGIDIPAKDAPTAYEDNSPERRLVEFLTFWEVANYGHMALCISRRFGHSSKELPAHVREEYYGKRLRSWELMTVQDVTPEISVITLLVTYEENGLTQSPVVESRLLCENDAGKSVLPQTAGSQWRLLTWYLKRIGN
jgi:hypothetical protein